ncbi:pheromone M-factor receptor Map3 [Schizosaccharomyces japonicus yFS275]|uniref:Pheromone M-factor receptor Map3 n=1 Tax=Schizosaccharomyces japonicus (strain yFS275 / FY16936) TaxID=402676 RepID=B6K0F1_SCHJY|nr:pheromone M-factor receptor Map3 [Schizosaccharomyces japonicus yFS275]EEB06301.1 pheromone M-factor receptor Map3 [Schizosaccharomyces japonicus yFS275]
MYSVCVFYQVYAYLSILLAIPLGLMQMRARNVPCIALLFWLTVATLIYGVDNAIWWREIITAVQWKGFVWCDVTSQLLVASGLAIPQSAFCMVFYLDSVVRSNKPLPMYKHLGFNIFVCFISPFIGMGLAIMTEGARYYILGMNGCRAAIMNTWFAFAILTVPPCLACLFGLFHVSRVIWVYVKKQKQLEQYFKRDSYLTSRRFVRLLCLALVFFLGYLPLTMYLLISNCIAEEWIPFRISDFHPWNKNDILGFEMDSIQMNSWVPPTVLYVMVLFFGTSKDFSNVIVRYFWVLVYCIPGIKNTRLGRHANAQISRLDTSKSSSHTLIDNSVMNTDGKALVLERVWSKFSVPSDDTFETK